MKPSLLSLAGAALVVTTVTACGSTTPTADEPSETASAPSSSAAPTDTAGASGSADPSDATSSAAGDGEAQQAASPCRTDDLSIEVTEESQAGGYYLITATAKPGVTCTMNGETAPVAFGSSEDSHAGPTEQAPGEPVEVSGDAKAYAGVNPKSIDVEGVRYPQIIVSATPDDPNPVSIDLPKEAEVAGPVATNWVATAVNAVPF